ISAHALRIHRAHRRLRPITAGPPPSKQLRVITDNWDEHWQRHASAMATTCRSLESRAAGQEVANSPTMEHCFTRQYSDACGSSFRADPQRCVAEVALRRCLETHRAAAPAGARPDPQ